MSAQFIIGRAGSGKTAWAMQRTVAACKTEPLGEAILWIVPRQATFQTQRDLCCGSGLDGFFRVQVYSFEQLCRTMLCEVGGGAAPEISAQGRQMILGHLLRKNQGRFRFFKSSAPQGGLAIELSNALDELERGGVDLTTLGGKLPDAPGNSALSDKITDLAMLQGEYATFLGRHRLDPDRQVIAAMAAFERSSLLATATVYIDGFLHFTQRERRLIAALGVSARSLRVSLTIDPRSEVLKDVNHLPDELSLFHAMEMEYRKLHFAFLQSGVKLEKPVVLDEQRRFKELGPARVEKWETVSKAQSRDGVELIECCDKRAEVDAAARKIVDLVRGGARYRDIVVLTRELRDYHDLIHAAFGEHGIPYFADQRRSAGHHPVVQVVRALLALAIDPWHTDAMINLIKSGLCGLSLAEADELENYVLLHGIRAAGWSDPKPWTGRRDLSGEEESRPRYASPESADRLRRRVVDPLQLYVQAVAATGINASAICKAMLECLERLDIKNTLNHWIEKAEAAGRPEEAEEHEQLWTAMNELIQQIVDLLGDEAMSLADFVAVVEGALAQFNLAIAPVTVDQVLVGQVDRTRPPAVKIAIVLGLSDGQFPRSPLPRTVLNDADRRALAGWTDLEGDSQRQALDEEFLGYFAFTRASERLIVTRPAADDSGRALSPGSLWRKLLAMVPVENVVVAPRRERVEAAEVTTPRQLIGGLMQWARQASEQSSGEESEGSWPALYQWLATRNRRGDVIDSLRERAWPALGYVNRASLSPELARGLFPSPLKMHVREVETFAACSFQHFARYGLKLSPRGVRGVNNQDVSRLYHAILDDLLRQLLREQRDWRNVPAEELHEILGRLTLNIAAKFKDDLMLSSARNLYVLKRIEATLRQVIATQRIAGGRSEFVAGAGRTRYGDDGDLRSLEVKTPGGNEIHISGEIDRVDVLTDGKTAVIHDYQLKARRLGLSEVYHGLSLKLIADLLAWEQTGGKAAAGLSTQLLRPVRDADPADAPQATEDAFHLQFKSRGIIDGHHVPRADTALSKQQTSEVLAIYVNKEADFGRLDTTDVAHSEEFAALLQHVRDTLARLGGEICAGKIAIAPYKLGNQSPCPICSYRDMCRFVPADGYVNLAVMKRTEVLSRVREGR